MFRNYLLFCLQVIMISINNVRNGNDLCNEKHFQIKKQEIVTNPIDIFELNIHITLEISYTKEMPAYLKPGFDEYVNTCIELVIVKGKLVNNSGHEEPDPNLTKKFTIDNSTYRLINYKVGNLAPLSAYKFSFEYKLKNDDTLYSSMTDFQKIYSCFGTPGQPKNFRITAINTSDVAQIVWDVPTIKEAPFISFYRVETLYANGTKNSTTINIVDPDRKSFNYTTSVNHFLNGGKLRINFGNSASSYTNSPNVSTCPNTSGEPVEINKELFIQLTGITNLIGPNGQTITTAEPNSAALNTITSAYWTLLLISFIFNQF
jgi:hypothetical protein